MARARASLVALLAGCARAQDWGLRGAWELMPTGVNPGPALAYRGATATAGSIFVTSNDTANGGAMGASMS